MRETYGRPQPRTGASALRARPLTGRCWHAYERGRHAVLGISPFNSYFSVERIRRLALWASARFRSFHLFLPDRPAAYTLEAMGYPPQRAAHKARRQANHVRNKIERALAPLGLGSAAAAERVLDWERLEADERYRARLSEHGARFREDADFRALCLEAAGWVLEKRLPRDEMDSRALCGAARYALAELPLLTDSVGILGQDASVFCYHETPPFVLRLYRGRTAVEVAANQGFVQVTEDNPKGNGAGEVDVAGSEG